jgi:hypothetical protein
MVVSDKIGQLENAIVWLGGGHKDLKLGIMTPDVVASSAAIVGDITF